MDLNARREELREHIARAYHAIRFSEILPLVPEAAHRARIIAKAAELFGIPDRNDTGDKIFGATLTGCRLKEDSLPTKSEREKVRGHMVALLTESALISEAAAKVIAYDAPLPNLADGAKIEQEDDPFTAPVPVEPEVAQFEPVSREPAIATRTVDRAPIPAPKANPPTRMPAARPVARAEIGGLQIFETDQPIRPLPPVNFVSLLQAGPGPKADGRLLSRWLSGVPSHPGEWAIGPRRLDAAGAESFAEIETDMLASPGQYLARHGQDRALSPDAPSSNRVHPTDMMSRMMAAWPGSGLEEEAVDLFRKSLGEVIAEYWPERAADLTSCGATLTVGSQLVPMLGAALAAERQWIGELAGDTEGRPQIVMGDVDPRGRIDEGLMFRRMAFLGYGCDMNATAALAEAAIGMRHSLMHRLADQTPNRRPCGNFDELFNEDCGRPLQDYLYMKPEPEPEPEPAY